MENFFKQFQEQLKRRTPPPFEEQDWRDLEKRLDQQSEKKTATLTWLWLAWPFLFLSLGANALFFYELKNDDLPTAAFEMRRDTVFLTKTIYKTDTIYQTRVLKVQHSASFPSHLAFLPAASNKSGTAGAPSESLHAEETVSIAKSQFPESLPAASEALPTLPTSLPSTLNPPPSTFLLPEVPVEPAVSKQKKTLQYHLYALRPKGFQMGFAGGWAYPFSEGLERQGGYSAGLEAAVEFSQNLRMWAGATYFNVCYISSRMGADVGIPVVAPPSDDFTFVEAEAPQPSWEYGIGMQYLFNVSRKFKPFLGTGWGAVSLLPYEVVYDFENQPLGVEWSLEKEVNRREFLTNFLLLRAGFESEISKNWHWQLRVNYRTQLGTSDFQTPDILGIQAGLMRRF